MTAVILDGSRQRALGLEVAGSDKRRWFVPWIACVPSAGEIACFSPLVFLPESELEFYVERGARVAAPDLGALFVGPDGTVVPPPAAPVRSVSAPVAAGTRRR